MLSRRLKSFRYAFNGLFDLIKTQPNVRIHLAAMCLVVAGGLYFHLTPIEWCLISLAIALVLAAEAFNTALEYLTNLVSPDYNPLAGKTKDVAAAGVLLAAAGALAVGLIIFVPKIWLFITG